MVSGEICGLSRISSKKLPGAISVNKKHRADTPTRSKAARNNLRPRYFILRLRAALRNSSGKLLLTPRAPWFPGDWDSKSVALLDPVPQFSRQKSRQLCRLTALLAANHEK